MKAIRVHAYGDPSVMQLEDLPLPVPGLGQVRVKIEAIGLNYVDTYQRSGQYKIALPFTPGQEAAGVVDALGEGVTEFSAGMRVAYPLVNGAYAEYAVVPANRLVRLPDAVSFQDAAALLVQGLTAHFLAQDTFALKAGHSVLIHAAAGGVGLLLVQMVKKLGVRVIGTTSSEAKAELVRQAGADDVILYTEQDFEAETRRLTAGRGVDVVFDSVGKDTFDKSMKCLRPRGYLVLFGQSSGAVPPVDPQSLAAHGSLFLTRPTLGSYLLDQAELKQRADDIFSWLADGSLTVRIDRTFPLAEAAAAHEAISSRGTAGKVLLLP